MLNWMDRFKLLQIVVCVKLILGVCIFNGQDLLTFRPIRISQKVLMVHPAICREYSKNY